MYIYLVLLSIHTGDWWKSDIEDVLQEFLRTGGDPNSSDALTINGQPGDLYPCSKQGAYIQGLELFCFIISFDVKMT